MLRAQKLVPRIPPRLLAPLIRLLGRKRFVDWSFDHYLRIAPPPPASADHEDGAADQQDHADDPLGTERDLVQAKQA